MPDQLIIRYQKNEAKKKKGNAKKLLCSNGNRPKCFRRMCLQLTKSR